MPGNFHPWNGLDPDGVAVDKANGNIYLSGFDSNNVSVIKGTLEAVNGAISVG